MCMSCSTGRITKKKIAIFSSIGVLIVVGTYFAFVTTNNPAVAAAIPALLSFAACPAMCMALGGIMWFSSRFSRNKNKYNNILMDSSREQASCSTSGVSPINKKERALGIPT